MQVIKNDYTQSILDRHPKVKYQHLVVGAGVAHEPKIPSSDLVVRQDVIDLEATQPGWHRSEGWRDSKAKCCVGKLPRLQDSGKAR